MGGGAVIVVGASDPTGGSGLSLDAAFLGRLGVRAAPVVAALGAENEYEPVPWPVFERQLDVALRSVGAAVRAIKTGLLLTPEQAETVARLSAARGIPLVVDPQLSRPGDRTSVVVPLVKSATLMLPDAAEASLLAGEAWDRTREGLLRLARSLVGPARTACVSGADTDGDTIPAAVAGPGGERIVEAPRVSRGPLQGTSCAVTSAAAAYIALGLPPLEAAAAAHRFVAEALGASAGIPGTALSPEPWAV